jgi:DNA integrity scanning protein DisA with diadenylate cyclase activity
MTEPYEEVYDVAEKACEQVCSHLEGHGITKAILILSDKDSHYLVSSGFQLYSEVSNSLCEAMFLNQMTWTAEMSSQEDEMN